MHQQGLAGLHVQQMRPGERGGGSRIGIGKGNGRREIEAVGQGVDVNFLGGGKLCEPAPVQHRTHAIAGLEAGDLGAHAFHHAGHFGARHKGQRRFALVFALHHQTGGEAHAGGMHAEQEFVVGDLRQGQFLQRELIKRLPLRHQYALHGLTPAPGRSGPGVCRGRRASLRAHRRPETAGPECVVRTRGCRRACRWRPDIRRA